MNWWPDTDGTEQVNWQKRRPCRSLFGIWMMMPPRSLWLTATCNEKVCSPVKEHFPNIVIRKTKPLGHYGRLRKAYLEMHRPILFNELVLSDKLFEHCAEIDEAARNRMELIVRSLAEQNGVTEQLKAKNQMEWVRQMNACKAQAEEIVKAELIYD